jgi:hypothetical protein
LKGRIDARAVIADGKGQLPALAARDEVNIPVRRPGRVLAGVVDEVEKHLADRVDIGVQRRFGKIIGQIDAKAH